MTFSHLLYVYHAIKGLNSKVEFHDGLVLTYTLGRPSRMIIDIDANVRLFCISVATDGSSFIELTTYLGNLQEPDS